MKIRWVVRDYGPGLVQHNGDRVTYLVLQFFNARAEWWEDVPLVDEFS